MADNVTTAALSNITARADIATTARIITFVSKFNDEWIGLRNLMGIMRPIRRAPGTVLKSKYAELTLQDGTVEEGGLIPFSKAEVKEKPYGTITIDKYAKSVSIEAIDAHGYDDAILRTDREFRRQLISGVQNKFYTYLQSGTLTGSAATFQMAIAKAEGLVRSKWDAMDKGLTEIVGFCNIMDAYEYLGAAQISTQTQFGMEYLENFMGMRRLFLSSKVPAGTLLATPVDNIVMYYVDPSDSEFVRAGLSYTAYGDVPGAPAGAQNLVGFHIEGDYTRASSNSFAIMGVTLFAEYLDGIAKITISASPAAPNAKLSALTFGAATLSPTFDPDVTTYTVSTSNAQNTITATAADSNATIAITNGDTPVTNGTAATWEAGENTVTITVTNGAASKTYTVTVTKT